VIGELIRLSDWRLLRPVKAWITPLPESPAPDMACAALRLPLTFAALASGASAPVALAAGADPPGDRNGARIWLMPAAEAVLTVLRPAMPREDTARRAA
jgi:hypothetical protein